jgi:hypothetical protein
MLSGEVSCPPCPTAPLAPIPLTPPVLGDDATQADKDAAESDDRSVIAAYKLKFQQYSSALETYRLDLTAYTQWMDEDARAAVVLTSNVLPQFASEFMGLLLLLACGLIFVGAISHPGMLFICLWFVGSMLFSRAILLLMSSTLRVLLSGVSLTLFALWFVAHARVVGRCARTWSFSASMSSYLGSARSLSPAVRSCLLMVVFQFLRCCLSFGLRRLASVVLVFLRFLLCLLLVVLLRRLHPRLSCDRQFYRFYPLLRVRARVSIRVSTSSIVVRIVVLLATAPTAIGMDTLRPIVIRRIPVCVACTRLVCLLVHQALLQLSSLIRILSVVFVVYLPLQVLLRWALLVL